MRIKKDVRTITQSEEQEKLLSNQKGSIRDRKFNTELQFLVDENKKSNTRKLQFYVELAWPYVAYTTFAQENVLSELLLKWI